MKKLIYLTAIFLMSSTLGFAQVDFYSSSLNLSEERTIGDYIIRVFSKNSVDVSLLFDGIYENDSSEVIRKKLDENRKRSHPIDEIAVNISVNKKFQPDGQFYAQPSQSVELVDEFFWWNISHSPADYWYARRYADVATAFVNVHDGEYDLYAYDQGWHYQDTLFGGDRWAGHITNGSLVGFGAIGFDEFFNTTDAVMFFFD